MKSVGANLPNITMQATVIGEFQEMLMRENIDFYVSHALDFTWHAKSDPLVRENFSFLQVKEAANIVSTLAFCNNTEEGREIISKINALLETSEFSSFWETIIRKYYPPELVDSYVELHRKQLPKYAWPE